MDPLWFNWLGGPVLHRAGRPNFWYGFQQVGRADFGEKKGTCWFSKNLVNQSQSENPLFLYSQNGIISAECMAYLYTYTFTFTINLGQI